MAKKPRPTPEELCELIKHSSLPTVLVEGKDDIIFYRAIEDELNALGVDFLPAGNKDAVIRLHGMLKECNTPPIAYIVDNDLWVHQPDDNCPADIIKTLGYSIENDLFIDGDLESLLTAGERVSFKADLEKFIFWYSIAISRKLLGKNSQFRAHPNEVLDSPQTYEMQTLLQESEDFPNLLFESLRKDYSRILRGKSLLAVLQRKLSAQGREVKFSNKQLIAFGASRRGANFIRIRDEVSSALSAPKE